MTQTPLQEAIEIATGELYQTEGNIHQRSYNEGIRDVLKRLESLLPKEKEFVGKIWNAGFRKGWQEGENRDEPYDDPALSKPEFINQLYPEK